MKFYTNVYSRGKYIYHRGYSDGEPFYNKIQYEPSIYVLSNKETGYTSLDGRNVERRDFEDIYKARKFIEMYQKDYLFGQNQFQYTFINEKYQEDMDYDVSLIKVDDIDIETESDNGFPYPDVAKEEVISITLKRGNRYYVFGCREYTVEDDDVTYFLCENEKVLLRKFVQFWSNDYPDIITGWNIEMFDIKYLVNRIIRVFGDDKLAKRLSPYGFLDTHTLNYYSKRDEVYGLAGISTLDYLRLFRKFVTLNRPSFKLDDIALEEIDAQKLDYSEYDTLHELYLNNFQKFINYNIHDVRLVEGIDDKLGVIAQAISLAYDNKVNLYDVFSPVKVWHALTNSYLDKKNIIAPMMSQYFEEAEDFGPIKGAYVKDIQPGLHKWVLSFDLNSLYPHLIMQYNIGPDTFRGMRQEYMTVDDILGGKVDEVREELIENNYALAANGIQYDKSYRGMLSVLMDNMYTDRVKFKNLQLKYQQELEHEKDPEKRKVLESEVAKARNIQNAKKVVLNSGYGAFANKYFKYYNPDIAESITVSGQLTIRWIFTKMNEYLCNILGTEGVDYVIACDTDSMYLNLGDLVTQVLGDNPDNDEVVKFLDKACATKFEPYIEKCFEELSVYMNSYAQRMVMKREVIADKAIWLKKKHYIMSVLNNEGVQYAEPELKILGVSAIKSSTPTKVKKAFKDCIQLVMTGTESQLQKHVKEFKNDFWNSGFDGVSTPSSCSGINDKMAGTSKTKMTPYHVKGAMAYNHYLINNGLDKKFPIVQDGDKVNVCYLKVPNFFQSEVVASPGAMPKSIDVEPIIDYNKQFEKAFVRPLQSVLDHVGWRWNKIRTLQDFGDVIDG